MSPARQATNIAIFYLLLCCLEQEGSRDRCQWLVLRKVVVAFVNYVLHLHCHGDFKLPLRKILCRERKEDEVEVESASDPSPEGAQ